MPARTARSAQGLRAAPHQVVYLELADVQQVRAGGRRGLVLSFGAGPTGTAPANTTWLWGLWGEYCVLRDTIGGWSVHAIGPVIMSHRERPQRPGRPG